MSAWFAILVVLLSGGGVVCAKDAEDPVDRKVNALFAKANRTGNTGDQFEAAVAAQKVWDVELNRVYKELHSKLAIPAAAALQVSQRKWIEWRDSEFASLVAYYDQFRGTMYGPMRIADETEIIRRRAIQLKEELSMLDMREIK
jgi:uncharacterized protein YecT (DUF1311 family)